jgi:hypothetical protein
VSEFFVLLPIRDESDIIAQCLDHLLKWAEIVEEFQHELTEA